MASVNLEGRVALVVGASSGMGRAIALACAGAGAQVMAVARREDQLAQVAAQAVERGTPLWTSVCDATDRGAVTRVVAQTAARWGRLDLLVYATGTNTPDRSLTRLTPELWELLLSTNLTGALHFTQSAVPEMRRNGGGLIVYLSSACVQRPDVSGVAYQASKHGLVGLAHGTRVEEGAHGIRTTVIFPGLCDTEILARRPVPTPAETLSKALQPEDVAAAVLFVAQLPPRALVPELQLVPSQLWT